MTSHTEQPDCRSRLGGTRPRRPVRQQGGVVLIMALIMLVIITLLATYSLRNSASTEAVSGNVRTTELATQAAESALRYCEDGLTQSFATTPTFTLSAPGILPYLNPPRWNQKDSSQNLKYWDGTSSLGFNAVIAVTSVVNGTTTFKRPPECMIEREFDPAATDPAINTATFIITARGFGPEVAAVDAIRSRPVGSEVWLQSTIGF